MRLTLSLSRLEDYRLFLQINSLPTYEFRGREAIFPDEYAGRLGLPAPEPDGADYDPWPGLFDYQEAIARIAIRRRKFAIFAECGYGKTLMAAEYVRHVDFAIFSPPFPKLYAYTSLPEDIGNSEDLEGEAKLHLSFFYRGLARVLKPGRVAVVHLAQIPRMKRAGGQGMFNFRDLNCRIAERAGLIYEYEWAVRKNPQAQAIRTKSRELQFAGLESDRARCRGAMPDFLIKFTAPGRNEVPVDSDGDVSRSDWIQWAEHCWADIRETDTLNVKAARTEEETQHICPLQLGVIQRFVRLFTNPNEIVFSPFAGIGSEGYEAVKLGRRAGATS